MLKELATIAREQLPATDRTSYDIFKHQSEMAVEGFQHRYHLIRTTTTDGVQNSEQIVDALRFQTIKDYDDWLARLDAFPTYVDQNIALMREGLKTNVLLPKVIVERVRGQLAELVAQPAEKSGFYRPFRTMPDAIAPAERERLTKAGLDRVRTRVQPSFARLLEFLEREYLPASYEHVGWWQTSGGEKGYQYLVRLHTTTALKPAGHSRARPSGGCSHTRGDGKHQGTRSGSLARSLSSSHT